jgi:hypothetical protein
MAARLASCLSPSDASSSTPETEFNADTDPSVRSFRDAPEFARLDRLAHLITLCTPSEVRTLHPHHTTPTHPQHSPHHGMIWFLDAGVAIVCNTMDGSRVAGERDSGMLAALIGQRGWSYTLYFLWPVLCCRLLGCWAMNRCSR